MEKRINDLKFDQPYSGRKRQTYKKSITSTNFNISGNQSVKRYESDTDSGKINLFSKEPGQPDSYDSSSSSQDSLNWQDVDDDDQCEEEEEQVRRPSVNQKQKNKFDIDQYINKGADGAGSSSSGFASTSEEEVQNEQVPLVNVDANNQDGNDITLYRQEYGGIVVYDSTARMMGHDKIGQSNPFTFISEQHPIIDNFDVQLQLNDTVLGCNEYTDDMEAINRVATAKDFENESDRQLYQQVKDYPKQKSYRTDHTLQIPKISNILQFESRFENGNLKKAIMVSSTEYSLWLDNDFQTKGHTQWFYFKIHTQLEKGTKIRFNILNLMKPQSLYNFGMKPLVFSNHQFKDKRIGWHRDCTNISYFQNEISRKGKDWQLNYYTLTFTYQVLANEDEVTFAHAVPYSYTKLQKHIKYLGQEQSHNEYLRINTLCKTLGGNSCKLLTITDKIESYLPYWTRHKLQSQSYSIRKALKSKFNKLKKLIQKQQGKKKKGVKDIQEDDIQQLISSLGPQNNNSSHNSQLEGGSSSKHQSNEEKNLSNIAQLFEMSQNKFDKMMLEHYTHHCHKKAIFITSRVHPGESQSSWVLQGFLEYLLTKEAQHLRQNYVFYVIPMLNPDGVIYGNYRCSLLGVDLNRRWIQPNRYLHPTVFHTKKLVRMVAEDRKILMYCDMHGHSRKMNSFTYGCSYKGYEFEARRKNALLRMIPLMFQYNSKIFNYKDCKFRIEKCKESTARIVLFKEYHILNCFTLESTYYGPDSALSLKRNKGQTNEEKLDKHMDEDDFKQVGRELGVTLNHFIPTVYNKSKIQFMVQKLMDILHQEYLKSLSLPPTSYHYNRKQTEDDGDGLLSAHSVNDNMTTTADPSSSTAATNYLPVHPQSQSVIQPKEEDESPFSAKPPMVKRGTTKSFYRRNTQSVTPGDKKKFVAGGARKKTGQKKSIKEEVLSESAAEEQAYNLAQAQQPTQEELKDIESFIQLCTTKGSKGPNAQDDDDQGDTDSSDSEESVKNMILSKKNKKGKKKKKKDSSSRKVTPNITIEANKENAGISTPKRTSSSKGSNKTFSMPYTEETKYMDAISERPSEFDEGSIPSTVQKKGHFQYNNSSFHPSPTKPYEVINSCQKSIIVNSQTIEEEPSIRLDLKKVNATSNDQKLNTERTGTDGSPNKLAMTPNNAIQTIHSKLPSKHSSLEAMPKFTSAQQYMLQEAPLSGPTVGDNSILEYDSPDKKPVSLFSPTGTVSNMERPESRSEIPSQFSFVPKILQQDQKVEQPKTLTIAGAGGQPGISLISGSLPKQRESIGTEKSKYQFDIAKKFSYYLHQSQNQNAPFIGSSIVLNPKATKPSQQQQQQIIKNSMSNTKVDKTGQLVNQTISKRKDKLIFTDNQHPEKLGVGRSRVSIQEQLAKSKQSRQDPLEGSGSKGNSSFQNYLRQHAGAPSNKDRGSHYTEKIKINPSKSSNLIEPVNQEQKRDTYIRYKKFKNSQKVGGQDLSSYDIASTQLTAGGASNRNNNSPFLKKMEQKTVVKDSKYFKDIEQTWKANIEQFPRQIPQTQKQNKMGLRPDSSSSKVSSAVQEQVIPTQNVLANNSSGAIISSHHIKRRRKIPTNNHHNNNHSGAGPAHHRLYNNDPKNVQSPSSQESHGEWSCVELKNQ